MRAKDQFVVLHYVNTNGLPKEAIINKNCVRYAITDADNSFSIYFINGEKLIMPISCYEEWHDAFCSPRKK